MKTYIKILLCELYVISVIILLFGPAILAFTLCFEVSYWYLFLLLSYCFLIPLYYVLYSGSKVQAFLNEYID